MDGAWLIGDLNSNKLKEKNYVEYPRGSRDEEELNKRNSVCWVNLFILSEVLQDKQTAALLSTAIISFMNKVKTISRLI